MEIKTQTVGAVTVVELIGEIDGKSSPVAQEKILPLIKDGTRLILDMNKVNFMSSAGLRLLLSVQRQLANRGKLVLVGLPEQIRDTMSITGFLDYFVIAATPAEGLALANRP